MASNSKKTLDISIGILFYLIGFTGFFYLYIFTVLFSVISAFSSILHTFCYIVLPIVILLFPIAWMIFRKRPFRKAVLRTLPILVVYVLLLFGVRTGITHYMHTFSPEKWQNPQYYDLRWLMMEDLENRYDLVGMTKEQVLVLLGKPTTDTETYLDYFIDVGYMRFEMFRLDYDADGTITRTSVFFYD